MRNALLLILLCLATPAFAGKGSVAPDVDGVKGARDARGAKDDDAPLDQREGLPAAAVFQRASPSVFVVWAKESAGASTVSQGSAVALTPELLVTNYHVVRGMKSFEAGRGDQRHAATVTAFDEAHDLALLTVAGLGARPARTRLSAEVAVGEHVYAIGAPRGMELTFSDGLVSAFREEKGGRIVQTTAPISPGSSGGGLFDGNGRLIGITTLTLRDSQNLNFALPMEWVDALRHGPGFDPKAAVALPPTPTWDLGHRPPRLHCDVDREQVWAVFQHGDEILESKPAKGEIFVQGFDGQLPVATAGVGPWKARVSLVLSNMDRRRGWLWFVPEHREERLFYLFDVDQSIFTLSIFVPFDFHGQPRFRVQTGLCKEAPPAKLVSGPAQPLSATCFGGNGAKCVGEAAAVPEAQSAVRLGLLRRGCELRDRASCEAAAKLARTLGMTGLAAAMEGQANALPAPPSAP